MSHATLTVHLTAERLARHGHDIDAALAEIMAPYNEQPEAGSPYLEFQDETDELRERYASSLISVFVDPAGVGKLKYHI